jgi:hypothetical protein
MPELQGVAVGKNKDGRLVLMATTNDTNPVGGRGSVWYQVQLREEGWPGDWRSRDVPIESGFGGPVIAQNRDGRLEIALTTNAGVLHAWQTAPNGEEWRHELFGPPDEETTWELARVPPALAQNRDGRLEVFALGFAGDARGGTPC